MSENQGQRFGRYELLEQIGRGSFALVFRARQMETGEMVALKIFQGVSADDEESLKKLRAEADISRTLLDHPNILRVREFGVSNGVPYLEMDYAPATFLQRFPYGTRLPLAVALTYAKQLGGALAYAHSKQVVHRDIKPGNFLLSAAGHLLLADFGIARILEGTVHYTQNVTGTPHYMAPEQFQLSASARSDQYAFAVVLYEWLTGQRPFEGDIATVMHAHLYISPEPLRRRVATLPAGVDEAVVRAMSKAPEARYPTVWAFVEEVVAASRAAGVEPARINQPEQAPPLPRPGPGIGPRTNPPNGGGGPVVAGTPPFTPAQPRTLPPQPVDAMPPPFAPTPPQLGALPPAANQPLGAEPPVALLPPTPSPGPPPPDHLPVNVPPSVHVTLPPASPSDSALGALLPASPVLPPVAPSGPMSVGSQPLPQPGGAPVPAPAVPTPAPPPLRMQLPPPSLPPFTFSALGAVEAVPAAPANRAAPPAAPPPGALTTNPGSLTTAAWGGTAPAGRAPAPSATPAPPLSGPVLPPALPASAAGPLPGAPAAPGMAGVVVGPAGFAPMSPSPVLPNQAGPSGVVQAPPLPGASPTPSAPWQPTTPAAAPPGWGYRPPPGAPPPGAMPFGEQRTIPGGPMPGGGFTGWGARPSVAGPGVGSGFAQATGAFSSAYHGHRAPVKKLYWVPGDQTIFSLDTEGMLHTWNVSGQSVMAPLPVGNAFWSSRRLHIACPAADGIRIYNLFTHPPSPEGRYTGQRGEDLQVAWVLRDELLVSGGGDQGVHVWNRQDPASAQVRVYPGIKSRVTLLAVSDDTNWIACAEKSGSIHVRRPDTGETLATYAGHQLARSPVVLMQWSPDGTRIASLCEWNQEVHIWEAQSGRFLTKHLTSTKDPLLVWSRTGKSLASKHESDPVVEIWDAASGETQISYRCPGIVTALAWSSDATRVATASANEVHVWDPRSGRQLFVYRGHDMPVTVLEWSPDDGLIASADSEDRRVSPEVGRFFGQSGTQVHVWKAPKGRPDVWAPVDRVDIWLGHMKKQLGRKLSALALALCAVDFVGVPWLLVRLFPGALFLILAADALALFALFGSFYSKEDRRPLLSSLGGLLVLLWGGFGATLGRTVPFSWLAIPLGVLGAVLAGVLCYAVHRKLLKRLRKV